MTVEGYLNDIEKVRFSIPDSGSGIAYEGILRIVDRGLRLEYGEKPTHGQKPDKHIPIKKWANRHLGFEFDTEEDDGVRILNLEYRDLDFVKRIDFFFFSTILLVSDSIETFRNIPSQKQGRLRLYFGMGQRQDTGRFVSRFNMNLADWRMINADDELERVRRFKA